MENNLKKTTLQTKTSKTIKITDFGRIPPQAIELEKEILGAILLNKDVMNEMVNILHVDSFYDPRHVFVFKAMFDLFKESKPIDLLTVINQLKTKNELELAGNSFYISQLTNKITATANSEYHARIVAQKHIQREIIRLSSEMLSESFEEGADIFELINKVEANLFEITSKNIKKNADEMKDVVFEAIAKIEMARKNEDGVSGVPTGFRELDKITAGWQKSDMIVIAARPGMGKTAFVLSMARNAAVDFNIGVAIFSLEMSSVQLVTRLISSETKIAGEKLKKGNLEEHEMQQLHSKIQKLVKAPIYFDDTPGINIFDFRAKCRRLKSTKNIEIIIVDYLQLMSAGPQKSGGNREQEISLISRTIKEIAKELNVPIIALSQLSRSVETRGGDKRPILSDLRESGSIEQDADIVSFIYRPEKYGITQNEHGESNIGIGEFMIEKHRNGDTGVVRLGFVGEFTLFKNLDEPDDYTFTSNLNNMRDSFDSAANENYTFKSKMNKDESDLSLDGVETPF